MRKLVSNNGIVLGLMLLALRPCTEGKAGRGRQRLLSDEGSTVRNYLPVLLLAAAFCVPWAQAQTLGAPPVNAASYANPNMQNGAIARGSIFTILRNTVPGAGDPALGPGASVQAGNFPLPSSQGLGGTSIEVAVAGQTVAAIMLFSQANQVSAILPSHTPLGSGTVRVTYNGQEATSRPITVVERAFGIFTEHLNGTGPAVNELNRSTPAVAGDIAVLWGTGLGAVRGNEAAAPLPGNMGLSDLHIWVGGKDATILYAGRSGCCAGVDQINFIVPSGVEGCVVPVAVQTGNIISNYTSMSISPNRHSWCSLPHGLTQADLPDPHSREPVDDNFRLANIAVKNFGPYTYAIGSFLRYPIDPSKMAYTTIGWANFDSGPIATGTCTVSTSPVFLNPPNANVRGGLDAGPAIFVNSHRVGFSSSPGLYFANLGNFSGVPTISNETAGTGAHAVGPFMVTHAVPPPLLSVNLPPVVVRDQGIQVTWAGGDPEGFVYINGRVNTDEFYPAQYGYASRWAVFSCLERASAGQFTVPPSVTLALPETEDIEGSESVLTLVSVPKPTRFTTTGLDVGYVTLTSTNSRPARYR